MSSQSVLRGSCVLIVGAFFLSIFFALPQGASAQGDPFNDIRSTTTSTPGYEHRNGGTLVKLSVYGEDGKTPLDRQSLIKATNEDAKTTNWQTTDGRSEAALELPFGKYAIEVNAVGYLSAQREVQAGVAYNVISLEIVLRRDPSAVDLSLADTAMPPKARKETKQAVSALKSGNLKDAAKKLTDVYKLAPSNSKVNFLMGYMFYQQKDYGQAQNYLGTAASLDPRDAQTLTLLGRTKMMSQDYPGAASTLEKAVAADSESWTAHNLLAGAYLKQRKYNEARQEAELAIAKGKDAAGDANLALGQALVNLGKKEDGLRALRTFVQRSPKNPVTPQVRELISNIESGNAGQQPTNGSAADKQNPPALVEPLLASSEHGLTLKQMWQPAGIDEVKPSVAAGVACPLDTIMEMSGHRTKELAANVSRIAALEHLLHERVDEMGNAETKETRDYNYVASIAEDSKGFLQVDDYRSAQGALNDFPDGMASSGFAALAFVFHPSIRENFETTCEGLGEWHGQAAWVIRFKQRDDRPVRFHDYKVGDEIYSVRLKGRAWVTANEFRVVRIESELVSPMLAIQLRSEHQVVEYGPVAFKNKNLELWLPQSAEIYLDFRKHRYMRRHSFDHYMLFAVDSDEKQGKPKAAPPPPEKPPNS